MKKSLMKSTSGAGLAGLLICGAFLTQTVQADEIKPAVSETNEGVTANTAETNSATATPLAPVKPTETTETAEVSKLKAEVADLEKQVSETETAHKVAAETTATAQKELDGQKESNQQAQAEIDKRNKEVEELQKSDQETSAASYKDYLEYLSGNTTDEKVKRDIASALELYTKAAQNDKLTVNNTEGNAGNLQQALKVVQVAKDINQYRKNAGIGELYIDPVMSVLSQVHAMYSAQYGGHMGEYEEKPYVLGGYITENISNNSYVNETARRWYDEEKPKYLSVADYYGLAKEENKISIDEIYKKRISKELPERVYQAIGHYINEMSNDQNLISLARVDHVSDGDTTIANFAATDFSQDYLKSGRIMTVADYEKSLKDFAEQFQAEKPNQAKIAQLQAEIKDFQARIKDFADLNKKLSDAQIKENELAGQLQELRQKQEQAKVKLKTAETPKRLVTFTEEETKSFVYQNPYMSDKKYYSDEEVKEIYDRAEKDADFAKSLVAKTPNLSQEEKENGFKEIDKDLALFKKIVANAGAHLFSESIYWHRSDVEKYAKEQHQKVSSREQTLKDIQENTSLSASNKLLITEEMMDYYNGPVEKEHKASESYATSKYQVNYDVASRLSNIQTIWNKYLAAQAKGQTATYTYQPVKDIQEVKVRYVEWKYEVSQDGLGKYFKVSLAPDEKRTLDLNDYAEVLKGAKLIDGYRLDLYSGYGAVNIQDGTVTYLYEKDTSNIVPPKVNVKYVALDTEGKELYSTELPVQFTRNDISTFGTKGVLSVNYYWDYASIKKSELESGSYILGLGKNNPLPRQITKNGKVYYQDGHEVQTDGDQNKVVYKYVLVGNESDLPKAEVAPEQPTQPVSPSKPVEKPVQPVSPNKPVEEPTQPVSPSKPVEKPTQPVSPSKPMEKPTQPVSPSKPVEEPAQPVSPSKPVEEPSRPSIHQRSLIDPVTGVSIFGGSDALAGVVRANIVVTATNVFGGQAYNAYDITLLNGNLEAVQPKGKVTVSLPTNGLEVDQVFHVTRDNQLEPLAFTVHQNIVTFETDHFSIYAVTYKTGQRVPERGTVSNLVSFTGGRSEVVQTATPASVQTENQPTNAKALPNTGETSNGFLALLGLVAGIFGITAFTKKED